jgi:hypothetical protein
VTRRERYFLKPAHQMSAFCGLTFELRRPARCAALAPRRTMEPATALRGPRAARLVGSPLERGVRQQCSHAYGELTHLQPSRRPAKRADVARPQAAAVLRRRAWLG